MKTRAEVLVKKMQQAYPKMDFDVETAFEYIESGGQVKTKDFRKWLEINGLWFE